MPHGSPRSAGRNKQAHDFGPARKIDRLSDAEQHAECDQRAQASGQAHQSLRDRPQRERDGVEPSQIHPIGEHAHRNLHQRIRPEERGEQDAFRFRPEVQLLRDQRERKRDRRPVEIVDERREEEQADDDPALAVHVFRESYRFGVRNLGVRRAECGVGGLAVSVRWVRALALRCSRSRARTGSALCGDVMPAIRSHKTLSRGNLARS